MTFEFDDVAIVDNQLVAKIVGENYERTVYMSIEDVFCIDDTNDELAKIGG